VGYNKKEKMTFDNDSKEMPENLIKDWWNNKENNTKLIEWDVFYEGEGYEPYRLNQRLKSVLENIDRLSLRNKARLGLKNANILELGYGAGQCATQLLMMGYKLKGIDISKLLCKQANRRCSRFPYPKPKEDYSLKVGSMERPLEYADNSFDLVVTIGTLHYIKNINQLFNEINRVLKPGGYFIMAQRSLIRFRDFFSTRYLSRMLKYTLGYQKYEILSKKDDYPFKKRLMSALRLRKLLHTKGFKVKRYDSACFIYSENRLKTLTRFIEPILQRISDLHLTPLHLIGDNIIVVAKKEKEADK